MNQFADSAPLATDLLSAPERIAHATLQLIADHGLSEITMSAIARKAGVARQTLYNHYPDVDSIIGAVVERHQQENLRTLGAVLATMTYPIDSLEHLVRHTVAMATHGHPILKHGLAAPARQLLDNYDRQMTATIETILRDGVEQGQFRPSIDPERDALLLQRMIEAAGELVAEHRNEAASIADTVIITVKAAVGTVA